MASGIETLRSIDTALAQARTQATDLSEKLQVSSAALMAAEQQEAQHYRELAKVRVSEMAQGAFLRALDDAERRTQQLLERRERELVQLDQRQTETRRQRDELEAQRDLKRDRLSQAGEQLDALEAQAQEQLVVDQDYQAQLKCAQAAGATAERAERKTELAEKDRREKGAPYEADSLFAYLWRQGYGTSGYRANALVRYLDGWLARLCRYHQARPNYAMLVELPERLSEHRDKVRAEADRQLLVLQALEEQAAERLGVLKSREGLETADAALAELDTRIEQIDEELAALDQQRADFAGGEDPAFREATDGMVATLRGASLRSLMREARETPTAADDRIVEALAEVQDRCEALEQPLQQGRKLLRGLSLRVKELEQIRQQFRKRRYDTNGSGFADSALIAMLLSQFMGGLMNSRDLWGSIENQQRWQKRRANPGFGSGGIRRGGGLWSGGLPRSRGRLGGGGGFGGGGFRTGGGFGGGGGFKTGGGF